MRLQWFRALMLALLLAPAAQSAAGTVSIREELGCSRPIRVAFYECGQVQLILSPEINLDFYQPDKSALTDFTLLDLSPAPPILHALVFSRRNFRPATANAWLRLIEDMRLSGTLRTIYRNRWPQPMSDRLLDF